MLPQVSRKRDTQLRGGPSAAAISMNARSSCWPPPPIFRSLLVGQRSSNRYSQHSKTIVVVHRRARSFHGKGLVAGFFQTRPENLSVLLSFSQVRHPSRAPSLEKVRTLVAQPHLLAHRFPALTSYRWRDPQEKHQLRNNTTKQKTQKRGFST